MKPIFGILILALALVACSGEEADPEIVKGQQLFAEHCSACHSLSGEVVIVGPSLNGVASRAETNAAGIPAREMLRQSILLPGEELVEGFNNLMPPDFGAKLSDDEIEALIAFLLTLE